ncbi:Eco57I restriction-modification methylase domain-containing protein [Bifidobacterium apri]|uniref:Eco57I restriction-modification methylase domain-containing protein n=1 Tax=Bifidobacterium apri TaxID=1769423 RepID=UPI003991F4D7
MNVSCDIQSDLMRADKRRVLGLLLQDKTSKRNILWGTDMYAERGTAYAHDSEITPELITGVHAGLIRSRAQKHQDQQSERTKTHAEVFTPMWVCAMMIDALDDDWFGAQHVFTDESGERTQRVEFPEGKTWQDYVRSTRLEITCGEAPFLVNRYDAATGEPVPVEKRIGILDRKLRVVDENAADEDEWMHWVIVAFRSTFGYEFQGDNLLIARLNLLATFEEYLDHRWHREAADRELRKIANIIVWNVWQMDGLTYRIPFDTTSDDPMDLFESVGLKDSQEAPAAKRISRCRVYDWSSNRSQVLVSERGKATMKFDYIIGNPPYQESDGGAGVSAVPLYNKFIESTKTMDPQVLCLVIPAKWYSAGKGLDDFRSEMLSDPHIALMDDYADPSDVFTGVDVAGGVCIFLRDKNYTGKCKYTSHFRGKTTTELRDLNAMKTFIRFPLALQIVEKVSSFHEQTLDCIVSARKPFGLPTKTHPMDGGDIVIRCKEGKGPYLRSEVPSGTEMIDQWKVIISRLTAEHAGKPDKNGRFRILSTTEELKPGEICSETYLVAGSFDSKSEADNYMLYLKTRFARFLISQIAITQQLSRASFAYVPAQDFTESWNDQRLYSKYGLTEDEIDFIESMIKEMK